MKNKHDAEMIRDYINRILTTSDIWTSILFRQFDLQTGIPTTSLTLVERSFLQLANVFFTTEGLFGGIVNLVVYPLIVNRHHDIWSEHAQKFAHSFEDVVGLELSVKIKFLEIHGFGFLCDICPRNVRNAVAHSNFIINPDGTVQILRARKETYSLAQLAEINEQMILMGKRITDLWSEELVGGGTVMPAKGI